MTKYDHFMRLLVMVTFIVAGILITAIASAGVLLLSGVSIEELSDFKAGDITQMTAGMTRSMLLIQHIFTFILPGIVFGLIFYGKDWTKGLHISVSPGWWMAIFGVLFLVSAYPLVNLSYLLNAKIELPSWAIQFENQAEDTLRSLLKMDSPWLFLMNLVIIAILPGIGEELIFRGILQKELGYIFSNKILAIWVAAFVFSAIHLQFEGFFPRMVLGVALGYLYYWTGNLWVTMIAHAFNNGIQIILIYSTGMDISEVDETQMDKLYWWMIPLSVGAMYFLYTQILKLRTPMEDV